MGLLNLSGARFLTLVFMVIIFDRMRAKFSRIKQEPGAVAGDCPIGPEEDLPDLKSSPKPLGPTTRNRSRHRVQI
jgi:hypothetical protein